MINLKRQLQTWSEPDKQNCKETYRHQWCIQAIPGHFSTANIYIYISFLHHRSPQKGIVFKTMREYIHSTIHLGELYSKRSAQEPSTDAKDEAKTVQLQAGKSETLEIRPQVELVKMFTDVSGEVREKSQFKLYTNHCYTVNKDSKPVVIEILKKLK